MFSGTDVTPRFSVGVETPDLGDPDEPLALDAEAMSGLADWYMIGWRVLDRVLISLPATAQPSVIQLWPEHFDAATDVEASPGRRVNLGVSPGDSYSDEPYLYIGPWGPERPGDPAFWNAPFGAVMRRGELQRSTDPIAVAAGFFRTGLRSMAEA